MEQTVSNQSPPAAATKLKKMDPSKLEVKPVTAVNWPDLEALFEGKGGPSYCWCMAWRPMESRSSADNAARKRALHQRVAEGKPIGLVGYLDGEAVAWCSVAPRETFLKLRHDQDPDEQGIWSVTCFFVRRDFRGSGIAGRMLEEAVSHARASGAKAVEAYPVDPDSPSYRFMGFVNLFRERGFQPSGRAGSRRYVMRLDL